MFLFSGVLATLVEPRANPGAETDYGLSPALPEVVTRLTAKTPRARVQRALSGDPAFLVDREERGFLMIENRLGCLVADGDPVVSGAGAVDLVRDFVELARAGGRVPVIQNARRRHLALYRSLGLKVRLTSEEPVVWLDRLDTGPQGHLAEEQRALRLAGATVDILPPEWVAPALEELRSIDPELDASRFEGYPVAVLRVRGEIQAFAGLWPAAVGGEVVTHTLRVAQEAQTDADRLLLAGILDWARGQGFSRFLAGAFDCMRPNAAGALMHDIPVRWEPRYTASRGGIAGLWARTVVEALTA